jgi:hypothetical protein
MKTIAAGVAATATTLQVRVAKSLPSAKKGKQDVKSVIGFKQVS